MTVLNEAREIEIGGKVYELKATTKALIRMEKDLGRSIFFVLQDQEAVASIGTLFVIFKNCLNEGDAEELFDAAVDEYGFLEFAKIITETFINSKVIRSRGGQKNQQTAQPQ